MSHNVTQCHTLAPFVRGTLHASGRPIFSGSSFLSVRVPFRPGAPASPLLLR